MAVKTILLNRLQQLETDSGIKPHTKNFLTEMALLNLLNDFEIYEDNPYELEDYILTLKSGLKLISQKDFLENQIKRIKTKRKKEL